jgi:ferric iron reductase protein FhuF
MIAPLQPLFVGEMAHHHDALALRDDPRPGVRADTLASPETLDPLLQRLRPEFTPCMRRGLVSEWSKWYFNRLTPSVTAAAVALDWQLPLAPDQVEVIFDEQGKATTFKLPHAGAPLPGAPATPFERFSALLDDHLAPLIDELALQSRLSPRVLWSNVGNVLEFMLNRLVDADVPAAGCSQLRQLLETRTRADGQRNPLYRPIHYVEVTDDDGSERRARRRRICCLRDQVPENGLCGTCPRKLPTKRGQTIRTADG